jgi:hypothetical protein
VALNGIKDSCCNEGSKERLYLSNSHELVALLVKLKLIDRYPLLTGVDQKQQREAPSNNQGLPLNTRQQKVQQLLSDYCEGVRGTNWQSRVDRINVNAEDIVLKPYLTEDDEKA